MALCTDIYGAGTSSPARPDPIIAAGEAICDAIERYLAGRMTDTEVTAVATVAGKLMGHTATKSKVESLQRENARLRESRAHEAAGGPYADAWKRKVAKARGAKPASESRAVLLIESAKPTASYSQRWKEAVARARRKK